MRGKDQVYEIRQQRAQQQAQAAAREERNLMAEEMLKKSQAMKVSGEASVAAGESA
jgi:hypothetical protein